MFKDKTSSIYEFNESDGNGVGSREQDLSWQRGTVDKYDQGTNLYPNLN